MHSFRETPYLSQVAQGYTGQWGNRSPVLTLHYPFFRLHWTELLTVVQTSFFLSLFAWKIVLTLPLLVACLEKEVNTTSGKVVLLLSLTVKIIRSLNPTVNPFG